MRRVGCGLGGRCSAAPAAASVRPVRSATFPAARSLSPCPYSLIMASSARVGGVMGQIALACGQQHDHSPSMKLRIWSPGPGGRWTVFLARLT